MAKQIIQEHPDTRILKAWARKQHEAGETLTYEAAAAVLRADPDDHKLRLRLRSAAMWLFRAVGAVYVCEKNVGYRLAEAKEAADLLSGNRQRVNRSTRRTISKAQTLSSTGILTDDEQARYFVEMTAAGAIGVASSSAARKRLESRASSAELPLAETLDVLKSM